MGIGSVTSANGMSGMQTITADSTDPKSKNIRNEIANAQQKLQKLTSKEDIPVNEKIDEQKKLQKEISSLNTDLKQHQETLRKSQKREIMLAKLQEDEKPDKTEASEDKPQTQETSSDKADDKNPQAAGQQTGRQGTVITNTSDGIVILKEETSQNEMRGADTKQANESTEKTPVAEKTETTGRDSDSEGSLSRKKAHAMVSADVSVQQANQQGTVITRTKDGIAILKGEIDQDEMRGADTEKKQAKLDKLEKNEQQALAFQAAILDEANNAMTAASETNAAGTKANAADNAFINVLKALQEGDPAAQQRFYVSLSN